MKDSITQMRSKLLLAFDWRSKRKRKRKYQYKNIPARLPNGEQYVGREEHKLVARDRACLAKSNGAPSLRVLIFIQIKTGDQKQIPAPPQQTDLSATLDEFAIVRAQFLKIGSGCKIDNDGCDARSRANRND